MFRPMNAHDPIERFSAWYAEALAQPGTGEPTAMTLATASKQGAPSLRVVLLKAHDARGFVFYTNMESHKSLELKANPQAALCFYWGQLKRQVRVEGSVEQVSDQEADAYFASRALNSQIGALASAQSRELDSRETLMRKVSVLEKQYSEKNPPARPAYWSGWRVVPRVIEFWQEGKFRLHDREVYTRKGDEWTVKRLYP